MEEMGWERAATKFGGSVKAPCELMNVLKSDINVEDYPRVMYEAGRQKELELEQQQEEEPQERAAQQ